jgi:hypothetical protein
MLLEKFLLKIKIFLAALKDVVAIDCILPVQLHCAQSENIRGQGQIIIAFTVNPIQEDF